MKKTTLAIVIAICSLLIASVIVVTPQEEGDKDIYWIPLSEESRKIINGMEPLSGLSEEDWPVTEQFLLERPDLPSTLPVGYEPKSKMELLEVDNCHVCTLTGSSAYDTVVLYVHGGAYVFDVYPEHMTFCDDIAQKTHSKVYIPCYPLAPKHTFEESYALLDDVYDMILKENKKVVIMGDSAGGGLALAYTLYLKEKQAVLPDKIVLLSPFLDATLSNPFIPEYEEKDIKLKSYGLIKCAKLWAGDADVTDYRISPINGDFSGLPHTFIFIGTAEIMYPDTILLFQKLKENGVDTHLAIADGLSHVFVLNSEFPEGKLCREAIYEYIL